MSEGLLKNLFIAIILTGSIFMLMFWMISSEYEKSPKVNGQLMGSGYECRQHVLYIVDGIGMSRVMTPAFDAKTSKVVYCD